MSSRREPLWYCHECNAEMRPLMVPDPVCASCHGSFVEKMDNEGDDPRAFHTLGPGLGAGTPGDDMPPGIDTFLLGLQTLLDRGMTERPRSPRSGNGLHFEFHTSTGGLGGTRSRTTDDVPTMSEFINRRSGSENDPEFPERDRTRASITAPLMAQYLLALLGSRGDPGGNFLNGMANGRMGDYVFGQEALDQIITQLMEGSNANRPVPATEDAISKLPKDVLEAGSPLLEKDCAVCKEQFKLDTDDPDEQVVVTLPCKHPFHDPCIMPWLKSSGTCPVCRYALVPQPNQTPGSPTSAGPSSNSSDRRSTSPPAADRPSRSPPTDSGFFQNLFNSFAGNPRSSPLRSGSMSNSRVNRSSSGTSRGSPGQRPGDSGSNSNGSHFPGSWSEDLD